MYTMSIEQIKNLLIKDSNKDIPQNLLKGAFVYAIFKDCVRIGKLQNNEIVFHDECDILKLLEIRIFNKECEYKAVYSTDKSSFIVRIKTDDEFYFLNEMYVFGEKLVNKEEGFITVVQDENYLSLPININKEIGKSVSIKLISHDYYKFNSNNVMYLADNRLVDFLIEEGEN